MTPFILPADSDLTLELKLIELGLKVKTETGYTKAEGVELSYSLPALPDGTCFVSGLIPDTMDAPAIIVAMGKDVNVAGAPIHSFLGQPAPDVEVVLDNLQIRLALHEVPYKDGTLLDAVNAAVAQAPSEVQIWWAEALRFLKSDPMVQGMAANLGVTAEQLDGIWALGATK